MLERHITNIQTNDELIHSQQSSNLTMSQPNTLFDSISQSYWKVCLICGSTEGIDLGNDRFADFCLTCRGPEIPNDQVSLSDLEDDDCKDEGKVQSKDNKRVNDDGEGGPDRKKANKSDAGTTCEPNQRYGEKQ